MSSSIVNNLKSSIKEASENDSKDLDNETKANLFKSIAKLSGSFLKEVNDGHIEVRDIKDMKDVASIYNMLIQAGGIEGSEKAPELSKGVTNYWVLRSKSDSADDLTGGDMIDQLENMSSKDINKMLDDQENIRNNENAGEL